MDSHEIVELERQMKLIKEENKRLVEENQMLKRSNNWLKKDRDGFMNKCEKLTGKRPTVEIEPRPVERKTSNQSWFESLDMIVSEMEKDPFIVRRPAFIKIRSLLIRMKLSQAK